MDILMLGCLEKESLGSHCSFPVMSPTTVFVEAKGRGCPGWQAQHLTVSPATRCVLYRHKFVLHSPLEDSSGCIYSVFCEMDAHPQHPWWGHASSFLEHAAHRG